MQDKQINDSQAANLLAEKDQEIARLNAELTRRDDVLSQEQRARLASDAMDRQQLLLPPEANPGQCFARAFMPPQYEIETVRVLKSDASNKIEITPTRYQWVQEQVLVKEASERLEVVPAQYDWVEEKVLVQPAGKKYVAVPAQYRSDSERVLDKPEHTVWKKGSGPITRIDEATGEIMCLVTVPATYKTVAQRVLVEDATVKEVEIPAEYKVVRKRVMKTPPSTRKVVIPAEYMAVKVRKLVEPPSTNVVEIPAQYETVMRQNMTVEGRMEWRPVLCRTNLTSDIVRRVQTSLDNAGYAPGTIDGILGKQTLAAIKRYQQDKELATGELTIETLESLNIAL
jgi:hypothetical protein